MDEYTPKFDKPVNVWDELETPYQQACKTLEGTDLDGIILTPEMVKQVQEFHKNNSLIAVKDGKAEPNDLSKETARKLFRELIYNKIADDNYDAGFEAANELNGVGKPLPSKNGSSAPQPTKTAASQQEKEVEALLDSLPK